MVSDITSVLPQATSVQRSVDYVTTESKANNNG